jgi:7-cyano-7-deazaguanine synthase
MKKAVVLLSGGLDSSTCAAIAKSEGFDITAVSFCYGQRHCVEIECAEKIAKSMDVKEHIFINIDTSVFKNNSLTDNIDVPKNRTENTSENEIPNTYVPARNTLFLSYALAIAESISATDIFIGITAVDYSGYPDCRPDYIEQYRKMAELATKTGREGKPLTIHTPLLYLSKSDIIKRGTRLGVKYELTHSCYAPSADGLSCGGCDSCLHRKKGFADAGINDPTKYF